MKGYTVFNAEQIDGLPAHFYATVTPLHSDITPLDAVERFFASTNDYHSAWRQQRLLQPQPRHRANAGATELSATRKATMRPSPMK